MKYTLHAGRMQAKGRLFYKNLNKALFLFVSDRKQKKAAFINNDVFQKLICD